MSALPKAEAARLRGDYDEPPEANAGLEERLWAALDRAELLLEARLDALEGAPMSRDWPGGVTGAAEAVRSIAETLERLGMLKPPPPGTEFIEHEGYFYPLDSTRHRVPVGPARVGAPHRTRRDVWDGAAEGERNE